ncbi:Rieske 2Fe-2S domain-containing protein [Micromonospora sp. WMMD1082]|uniref:QcrA and Rieske domain-containing protein n=1 Tax=Micromonospora sp. WMMD1082 TaxID=3016104 RepID=UPI00241597BF|nr:Rieske 2Fe-2S domain-containing protein [Micromonospora sp. WMMD1082]MDG4798230.1 Rieske 2Fe-2S domain-containing protein [Micromonospora sp. WMMD1082]
MSRERGTASVAVLFGVAAASAAGFATAYVVDAGTQWLGVTLGLALVCLAHGLSLWARRFLPTGGYVEAKPELGTRTPTLPPPVIHEETPAAQVGLRRLLVATVGVLGLAALFPLRSLVGPRMTAPNRELRSTPWQAGRRLLDNRDAPVRADDVGPDSIVVVYPEDHREAPGAPAFVVRLAPEGEGTGPSGAAGLAAYSLLCTHAGCPVGQYEPDAGRVFCPCHQSAFDLRAGARPVSGPAARPLPSLPIEVDADGRLRAAGGLSAAPGPGYWSRS